GYALAQKFWRCSCCLLPIDPNDWRAGRRSAVLVSMPSIWKKRLPGQRFPFALWIDFVLSHPQGKLLAPSLFRLASTGSDRPVVFPIFATCQLENWPAG